MFPVDLSLSLPVNTAFIECPNGLSGGEWVLSFKLSISIGTSTVPT